MVHPSFVPVVSSWISSGWWLGITVGRGLGSKPSMLPGLLDYKMGYANYIAGPASGSYFDFPAPNMKIGIDVF